MMTIACRYVGIWDQLVADCCQLIQTYSFANSFLVFRHIFSGILAIASGAVYSPNVDYDQNSYGSGSSSFYEAEILYCVQLTFVAGILAIAAFIMGLVELRRTPRTDNMERF